MASRRSEQQSEIQLKVMRLISEAPELSSRKIADAVGISNGSAYYLLSVLVEKRLVRLKNLKKHPKKNRFAYLLTPKGVKKKFALANNFIELKRKEYRNLKNEIESLEEEVRLISQFNSKLNIEENEEI